VFIIFLLSKEFLVKSLSLAKAKIGEKRKGNTKILQELV